MSTASTLVAAEFRDAPALRVLMLCGRRELGAEVDGELREALDAVPDDGLLITAGDAHRMLPLMHRHLAGVARAIGRDDLRNALEHFRMRNAAASLHLTALLREMLSAIAERGVRVLPYKGPMLAQLVYGGLALRQVGDIDIIVACEDVARASAALRSLGFEADDDHPATGSALFRDLHAYRFVRPRDGALVELHWSVAPRSLAAPYGLPEMWEARASAHVGGAQLDVMGAEDLALALCIHGANHAWERMEWVLGVAALAQRATIDWAQVLRRARRLHCERHVALALATARALYGSPSAAVIGDLHPSYDAAVHRILDDYREPPRDRDGRRERYARYLFHLWLQPSLSRRASYAGHYLRKRWFRVVRRLAPAVYESWRRGPAASMLAS